MTKRVSKEQIVNAKKVNLVEFLKCCFPMLIAYNEKTGEYEHPEHGSLKICERGFYHFSNDTDRGDQIQFVMNHYYHDSGSFVKSVQMLDSYSKIGVCFSEANEKTQTNKMHYARREAIGTAEFSPPTRIEARYTHAWMYLTAKRKIPKQTVNDLMKRHILYEDSARNCVFINESEKYGEIVGTGEKRFKGIITGSNGSGFWTMDGKCPHIAFVCESAIDAVSLATLFYWNHKYSEIYSFVSLGGLKDAALKNVVSKYTKVVLAVDNDEAGNRFAEKHPDLCRLVPPTAHLEMGRYTKDWNDVIMYGVKFDEDYFSQIDEFVYGKS